MLMSLSFPAPAWKYILHVCKAIVPTFNLYCRPDGIRINAISEDASCILQLYIRAAELDPYVCPTYQIFGLQAEPLLRLLGSLKDTDRDTVRLYSKSKNALTMVLSYNNGYKTSEFALRLVDLPENTDTYPTAYSVHINMSVSALKTACRNAELFSESITIAIKEDTDGDHELSLIATDKNLGNHVTQTFSFKGEGGIELESEYTPEQYRLAQIRNFLNCEPLCKAIGVKNIDVYLRNEMPLRMHVPIGDDGGCFQLYLAAEISED